MEKLIISVQINALVINYYFERIRIVELNRPVVVENKWLGQK